MQNKNKKNQEPWEIENANKIAMAEVVKLWSAINFGNKYSWAINNTDIDAAKDLKLIVIKK